MDPWHRRRLPAARPAPIAVLASACCVLAGQAFAPAAPADMTTALPLAGPAGALPGAPVRGKPIVVGRSPGTPTRVRDAAVLGATITPDPALADGADGSATIALARVTARDLVVRGVKLRVALPPAARARTVTAAGWTCTSEEREVACRLKDRAASTAALPSVQVQLDLRAGGAPGALVARGAWRQPATGGGTVARTASDELPLRPATPLRVSASPVDTAVADALTGQRAPDVVLRGTIARRGDQPIRYRWRQLCEKDCTRVRWTTANAGVLAPGQQPGAAFATPHVERTETLRFALEAEDARGRDVDTAEVRVLAQRLERFDPRESTTALAGRVLRDGERPGRPFDLVAGDRAAVDVSGRGETDVRPGGLVKLAADVRGQRETKVAWQVVRGPPDLLKGAQRNGSTLRFRAPSPPDTLVVRMTAWTKNGRFTRDELIDVDGTEAAAGTAALTRGAQAADTSARDQAFCRLLDAAREGNGRFSIPMESGGTLTADARRPAGSGCSGNETVEFADGAARLGDFGLEELRGTVTRERGLVVERGRLVLPDFWSRSTEARTAGTRVLTDAAAASAGRAVGSSGISIGFSLPTGEGLAASVGVRLGATGWGDLTGDLSLDQGALSRLPLAGALPSGWRLDELRLGVNPEAEQFELSAGARGPAKTAGDAALELDGALTFDGQVSVQVFAANLAVLESRAGQTTVSAEGELTLLPGRRVSPEGTAEGGVFPVVDVAVSGEIEDYRPADGLTLSGSVSWASGGPLEVAGTLVASAKGTDVRLDVAGGFTNAEDWELRGELTSESGVRLGDLLTLKRLEGTIKSTGGELGLSFSGEATDIKEIQGVKARNAKATLSTSDCAVGAEREPTTKALRVCLSVDATLDVTLPGADAPLEFKGGLAVDLSTLTFRVTGGLASDKPFGPKELKLREVSIWATNAGPAEAACGDSAARAAGSGLSFGFRAKGEVVGVPLNDVRGAYLSDNSYCLAADVGAANLPGSGGELKPTDGAASPGCDVPNAPALQGLRFSYASKTSKESFDGRFCLPQEVRSRLGRMGQGTGAVHLNVTRESGNTSLAGRVSYTLDQPYWLIGAKDATGASPDDTKAALAFRSLGFSLNVNSSGVDLGLDAAGTLRLPKPSGDLGGDAATAAPSQAPLTISATTRLGPNPSFTLAAEVGGDADKPCAPTNEGALRDVFGQKGLTVCQLGFSGELSASPSLSASASFTLPDAWSKQLGARNAAFRLGFSISAARPCVDLAIKQIDERRPAMDLFDKGALVTNQAHLLVAPSGCDLPRGGSTTTIPPGFKLDFDGVILGTPVRVFANIGRSGDAFSIDAGLKTGKLELGPVEFGETDIGLKADPSAGTTSIRVKTSMKLGNGGFTLDAAIDSSGSGASRKLAIKGSGAVDFSLAGASFKGSLTLDFESSAQRTAASFSGGFDVDLRIFKYGVTVKTLEYDSTKGGLQALDVSARGAVNFGAGTLSASGAFTYARNPGKIHINLSGTFSIWDVYTRSVTLDVDLGRIKLPFSFGPKEGAVRIRTTFGVVRVSGLNEGNVDASPDGQTDTNVTREVEVESCDLLEFFCLDVHDVRLNRRTGVLEGTVLGVFPLSVSARELATDKNNPPNYTTRFGNLVNESQGRCLEVPAAKYNLLQPLGTYACVGVRHERWSLAPSGLLLASGDPSKCLDATINKGENARPILFTCTPGAPNHRWHFDARGRLHAVTSRNEDRCLTAVTTTNPSGEVRMGVCNDSAEQRWALSGRIQPIAYPATVTCLGLDTDNLAPAPGRGLQTQTCINETAQAANQFLAFTPSGTLQVSGLCVDAVPGATQGNYDPKAETCDGSDRQRWELTKDGQFRNRVTGQCLLADDQPPKENQPRSVRLLFCGSQKRFQWDFGA
jgi:Ricin-type beta-trefoil lectin domain